jgi:hypothetical protein
MTVDETVWTASWKEGQASQEFISLLPLTPTMNVPKREKCTHLPGAFSKAGQ